MGSTIIVRRSLFPHLKRLRSSHISQICLRLESSLDRYQDSPYADRIIDVSDLAMAMRKEVRDYTRRTLPEKVRLVGILAHQESQRHDADVYSQSIAETFDEDGIDYELCECQVENVQKVAQVIQHTNERADVHGILVFYPIFQSREKLEIKGPYLNRSSGVYYKTQDCWLRDVVAPEKDVEGLSQGYNARWLFRARAKNRENNGFFVPCTASAVIKILETYHPWSSPGPKRWSGCTMTVVNRSEILGRPLAALLALEGATVFSVDEHSILQFMDGGRLRRCTHTSLEDCLKQSSIVVTGVPSEDFVLPSWAIRDGTTVVDVSLLSNVDDETLFHDKPNVRLVPHVGKVTVAALEQNLIRLHRASKGNS